MYTASANLDKPVKVKVLNVKIKVERSTLYMVSVLLEASNFMTSAELLLVLFALLANRTGIIYNDVPTQNISAIPLYP